MGNHREREDRGRLENTDRPKRFAVFPTAASIRGAGPRRYTVPDYPYDISVG